MVNNAGIRKYLDTGSLNLFARQLVDSLEAARGIAVCDADGAIAWCGPDDDAASAWPVNELPGGPTSRGDATRDLGDGSFAHAFPINPAGEGDGFLLVRTDSAAPLPSEDVRRSVQPILNCIHKQLDIGLGLSAARRQTSRDRANMALLYNLAGLRDDAPSATVLPRALQAAGRHFASDLIVLWMPEQELQLAWRADGPVSADKCAALSPVFQRLLLAAQRRRKVLVADAPAALQRFAHSANAQARILSAPLLNEHDEVAGVLALVGRADYSRNDLRFVRVVSSKLAALAGRDVEPRDARIDRHGLIKHIDAQLSANRSQARALLLLDIDKLHVINEMHGHFGGDAAIEAVMQAAQDECGPGDMVCDLSGGVVALYLSDADEKRAVTRAQRVGERVKQRPATYEGRTIESTVSIGIATMPVVVNDAASALNTAEVAVRSAKSRGGDTCVVFNDMDASVMRRREDLDQVGQLQAALLDNRFVLYAQRIVSLQEVESRPRYEILLRLLDEDGAVLSPDRFLSAAERYQMMSSIDRWVVRRTMDMLSTSDNLLEINLASFSINLSAQSLMDEEFPRFVEQCVLDSGISPDTFCFEITESSVMRNMERAQDLLRRFSALGCRVALDDFGTGQCSFGYLKDLPVQYVKIDGSFVRDIIENPLSEAIVESVARIARVMHARTVAEYVENDLIMSRLREVGIDFAQGYRIGKPKPLDDVLAEFGDALIDPVELLTIPA